MAATSVFIATALAFMMAGMLLGTVNLVSSGWRHVPDAAAPAWLQAANHALIFGWLATTVMALGWHWLLRRRPALVGCAWLAAALWIAGLSLRWLAGLYSFHWQSLLPASAALELLAYGVFASALLQTWPLWWKREAAVFVAVGAGVGLAIALLTSFGLSVSLARHGLAPAFSAAMDRRFLLVCTWGFLGPVTWALSAKWLPRLMGLKPVKTKILAAAGILDGIGIAAALAGKVHLAAVLILHAAIFAPSSLKVFGKRVDESRLANGIYIRLAYAWLRVAATIGVWASVHDATGIWAASRHALVIGFVGTFVMVMAQYAVPLLAGPVSFPRRASFTLLCWNIGCLAQVVGLIFAYQHYGNWAWPLLPLSACLELAAISTFGLSIALTLVRRSGSPFAAIEPVAETE